MTRDQAKEDSVGRYRDDKALFPLNLLCRAKMEGKGCDLSVQISERSQDTASSSSYQWIGALLLLCELAFFGADTQRREA